MGGISANTANYVVYGTKGYITVDGTDVGATQGDFVVEWGVTQYYPDFSQAKGPVAGTGKVTEGFFRLRCTITEFDYDILSKVVGSIGADSTGTSEKFGGASLGDVTEVSNVILTGVTRQDGKALKVTIPKAYIEVGNITFSKGDIATMDVTFHGLYTTSAPDTLPGYIEIAK